MISYYYKYKRSANTCEDLLTSITFDGLKHLPTEIFWKILKLSLIHDKLPHVSGELENISYWESWDAKGTSNSKKVYPDVFLRFYNFDVIIEAKSRDEKQQYSEQKENEIISYFNEYKDDNKQLYFIQLGGLHNFDDEPDFIFDNKRIIICKTNWTKLLHQIVFQKEKFQKHNLSVFNSYSRILDDIILGFELHQFYSIRWLRDLSRHKIQTSRFDFFNYAVKFKSNKNRLITPFKNLSEIKILNTTTYNLFEYAKPTQ